MLYLKSFRCVQLSVSCLCIADIRLHAARYSFGKSRPAACTLELCFCQCTEFVATTVLGNALQVSVWRQDKEFQQRFAFGKPLEDMTSRAATEKRKGTQIRFKYDETIFSPEVFFDLDVITRRLRELAFLNGSATLNFKAVKDGEVAREEAFHYEGGIAAYVQHTTADAPVLHDCMHFKMFQDQCEVCTFLLHCEL